MSLFVNSFTWACVEHIISTGDQGLRGAWRGPAGLSPIVPATQKTAASAGVPPGGEHSAVMCSVAPWNKQPTVQAAGGREPALE